MSPRIHQLPDELVSRIAAGEVVERPASIVKELVENSLDAGATSISVVIEGAGRACIAISDNGCGMTLADAHMALKRHATSKIFAFEDLESIRSFGFRGEALPSIASVSRLKLTTRSQEEDMGWELTVEGGKILSERPVAREPGTTLEVRDLFFNTPARYKFLKSEATERSQCLRVIEEAVFGASQAQFEVIIDKAKPITFPKAGPNRRDSLRNRIAQAWGGRWMRGLQPVQSSTPHFSLSGFVTNQGFHQSTPRYQFLFVNNRPVQNRRLTRAVYDAYLGQLPSIRHPGWALFLEVNPAAVDVNVHPSKREVKLTHESEIYGFVMSGVKNALAGTEEAPVDVLRSVEPAPALRFPAASPAALSSRPVFREAGRASEVEATMSALGQAIDQLYQPMLAEAPASSYGSAPAPAQTEELSDLKDPALRVLGQVRNTFLIAQTQKAMLVVDQHAAAEKIAYEKLMKNAASQKPSVQMLLVPYTWEVAVSLVGVVKAHLPLFQKMGFHVEPFGKDTFVVKSLPAHLSEKTDLPSLLDGLSDVLSEGVKSQLSTLTDLSHRLAAMTACKASVKAGDPLSLKECEQLLKELPECEAPFTCPHGRPTVLRLSYADLERRFRRS